MINKLLLFVSLCFVGSFAQMNSTNNQNISVINNFNADSLKFGDVIDFSANENKVAMVLFNDTNIAGYAKDTVKFRYGYRRGFVVVNSLGRADTTWRNLVLLDSVSTLPADTAGKWISKFTVQGTDTATGYEFWKKGLMDSSWVTGYVTATTPFTPAWASLAQLWIQGLSGNRTNAWIKVKLQWIERKFINVRQQ
jgi:hypothetical protein